MKFCVEQLDSMRNGWLRAACCNISYPASLHYCKELPKSECGTELQAAKR